MPDNPQVRVHTRVLGVGDHGWNGHWGDGGAEISTARPAGSEAIETGISLLLTPESFEELRGLLNTMAAAQYVRPAARLAS